MSSRLAALLALALSSLTLSTAWAADGDGDGFDEAVDCDDTSAAINPGATEVCNGVDDDCDALVDDADTAAAGKTTFFRDFDGDAFGDPDSSTLACDAPGGFVADGTDCDDGDAAIHPGATEICDAGDVDEDCDGAADDADTAAAGKTTFFTDGDGDGFGGGNGEARCDAGPGQVANDADCDDSQLAINPDGTEQCNGIDDDCDGTADEAGATDELTFFADTDGDTFGDPDSTATACVAPDGFVTDGGDCDDSAAAVHPGASDTCNGIDDDCDGLLDDADPDVIDAGSWHADVDLDGFGDAATATEACTPPDGFIADAGDCDDDDASIHPGATEVCDGVDQDCDAIADEGFGNDADDDGHPETDCGGGDCDDADPTIHPGATDVAGDGIDQDCDGSDASPEDPDAGPGAGGGDAGVDPSVGGGGGCGCAAPGDAGSLPGAAFGLLALIGAAGLGLRRRARRARP